jgi:hypothetical protein
VDHTEKLDYTVYPYPCTFPGHWMVMNGDLVVENGAKRTVDHNRAPDATRPERATPSTPSPFGRLCILHPINDGASVGTGRFRSEKLFFSFA